MSDQNFTNVFNISGDGNTVNFTQSIDASDGGNEALSMVLKFLLTLLLSPVMLPILLMANGYKQLSSNDGE